MEIYRMKRYLSVLFLAWCSVISAQKDNSFYVHWHEKGTEDFKVKSSGMGGRRGYESNSGTSVSFWLKKVQFATQK
jgi:hypothetical protein